MSRSLRLKGERAAAKVEGKALLDADTGQDDFNPFEGFLAQHLFVDGEITLGPRPKSAREFEVADESGFVLLEGGVPEHVVGVHVGIDDIADGLVGGGADSGP